MSALKKALVGSPSSECAKEIGRKQRWEEGKGWMEAFTAEEDGGEPTIA